MVKKLDAIASGGSESQLANAIKESATQIWLAGLGAFAKAQEEGSKVFEALVKEGGVLQRRARNVTEEKVAEVSERVTRVAQDLSKQANGTWDKLEQVFEERVARALGRLGVPSKKEVEELTRRIDALAKSAKAAGPKKARPAARKTTARRAA